MASLNSCNNCYIKVTTTGCLNCKIKAPINEINEFFESHKSNLSQFILYINTDYYADVLSCLKSDLKTSLDIRNTSMLKSSEIGVIVDKKFLDWGNIGIERGI